MIGCNSLVDWIKTQSAPARVEFEPTFRGTAPVVHRALSEAPILALCSGCFGVAGIILCTQLGASSANLSASVDSFLVQPKYCLVAALLH